MSTALCHGSNKFFQGGVAQILDNSAPGIDTAGDTEAHVSGNQGEGFLVFKPVKFSAVLPADFQDILKSRIGDEGGGRPLMLQKCIGGDGGAVDYLNRFGTRNVVDAFQNSLGRGVWVLKGFYKPSKRPGPGI